MQHSSNKSILCTCTVEYTGVVYTILVYPAGRIQASEEALRVPVYKCWKKSSESIFFYSPDLEVQYHYVRVEVFNTHFTRASCVLQHGVIHRNVVCPYNRSNNSLNYTRYMTVNISMPTRSLESSVITSSENGLRQPHGHQNGRLPSLLFAG
jgi:hypothetical protein